MKIMDFSIFPVSEVIGKPYSGGHNGMPVEGVITAYYPDKGSGIGYLYNGNRIAMCIFTSTGIGWRRDNDGNIVIGDGLKSIRIHTGAQP